ncbi:peroxisomal N(1)-acetyl-spermine/spermidine oxidase-like isoform X2 [Acanthaster planci]|uniref:Peroxisomal N(1)-acetyl-spermine/spermidine oxidase-like isoform X2 n=1 Tax=Acanthaster planci TaxID=133434 RepID=A0A8B7ZE67_ACAPL|nr:peroxisomal N(1)-acetyl-spermine/spermidine oxidase-like isoform X2 [Acanthaster planci]
MGGKGQPKNVRGLCKRVRWRHCVCLCTFAQVELAGPRQIELGANWIHGEEGNPVYHFARENGLLKEEDSSNGESSSDDSSSTCAESNDKRTWINTNSDGDIYFLEDGSVASRSIVKQVRMMYDNLITACRDESTHDGCVSVGEYFVRGMEQLISKGDVSADERHVRELLWKWCLRAECIDCACQSAYDLSLIHYNSYIDIPGDYYCCLGEKGYQGVLDVLLGRLPKDTVKFNKPVDQIVWKQKSPTDEASCGREPVIIRVKDHPDIVADHVIITSSIGYLKENHARLFRPALPEDKQKAIDTLHFGTVNKVFLKFEEPFWTRLSEGDVEGIQFLWEKDPWHDEPLVTVQTSDSSKENLKDLHDQIMRRFTGFDTVDGHDDVLCGWISGAEAVEMEKFTDADIAKMCTDILNKFLPTEIPAPTKVMVSRWHENPYIRGSYTSTLPMHGTGEEFDVLSSPVWQGSQAGDAGMAQYPVLLFAGEGCHKEYNSTVHAAMITGQQQAQRLIQFHQLSTKPSHQ